MQEELKHLFKTKEYAQCASLSEQVIRNAPDEYVGYVYKCLSLLALGRDEEAVSIAGKAIQLSSPRINGRLWRLISRAVNRFGKDPQTIKSFWVSCNSANENAFNSSMSHLLNADVERAISSLSQVPNNLFLLDSLEKIRECISILGGRTSPTEDEILVNQESHRKKVLVAGMGWSGSGAIFDYLSEFTNVTAVAGESPYLARGRFSLRTIEQALDESGKLAQQIIGFFYFNIIGFAKITGPVDLKGFGSARQRSLGRNQSAHFDAALIFCKISNMLLGEKDSWKRRHLFSQLATLVLERFAIPLDIPEGNIVVLDNVVPIGRIDAANWLTDTDIYCCFRDPRSNYVALLRENPRFDQGISSYINDRARSLSRLTRLVERIKAEQSQRSSSIYKVQFEEFVISEQLRDSMALNLGLSLKERNKYSRFKPWESMRNVVLHQEHAKQEEIKLIEKALGEYCYDLAVIQRCERSRTS